MELKEIQELLMFKMFDQALQAIENLPPENKFDGMILESKILEQTGNVKQALTFEKHALRESKKKEIPLQIQSSLSLKVYSDLFQETPDTYTIAVDLISFIRSIFGPGRVRNMHKWEEEVTFALDYIENYVEAHEKPNFEFFSVFHVLGEMYYRMGELKHALDFQKRGLKILQNDSLLLTESSLQLQVIGNIYTSTGDLNLALEFFKSSLNLIKELKNKSILADSLVLISHIYALKGEFEQALENIYQSLNIFSDAQYHLWAENGIIRCLLIKGMIYKLMGRPSLALENLEEALIPLR
ncbi:hypothetical protein CEE45_16835 [Candidatus Heimdallarchaeota archaeon B3_Heim]|nr:MAG: hypothetical protein CEE45_16835 [Candidatus Heimdallarchaeota archaeon B3_Heim]